MIIPPSITPKCAEAAVYGYLRARLWLTRTVGAVVERVLYGTSV